MSDGMRWGDFVNGRNNVTKLSSWKKDGSIVVWIHTNTSIHRRLVHYIPHVVQREDDRSLEKVNVVSYLPFVCHESVKNFFDRKKPIHCPMDRYKFWLGNNPKIDNKTIVWMAKGDDPTTDRVVNKLNFIGGGDWKLESKAQVQYVIPVVDHNNADAGISIAIETYTLGEAIKRAVHNEIKGNPDNPELGDPSVNPYAFTWEYNKNAKTPKDYYNAYRNNGAKINNKIRELLNSDEVDVSDFINPGNTDELYDIMKNHIPSNLDCPLDTFFDNVKDKNDMVQVNNNNTNTPVENVEYDYCGECNGKIDSDATQCVHCGAVFE